jgi:hypothetical protein
MSYDKENRAILNDISKPNCQLIENRSLRTLIASKDAAIRQLQVNNFKQIS